MMMKEDVNWFNDIEMVVFEDYGWTIIYHYNFFDDQEWFEVRRPDGINIGEYDNIDDAFDHFYD